MSENILSLFERAQNLIEEDKLSAAVEIYKEILSADSESLDALMGLGNCYLQLGDVKNAFEQFSKGRELSPTAVDFSYQYANCLRLGGYQKEALKELQRATGLCGDNQFFTLEIARVLVSLGEAQGALAMLERLEQLSPDAQIVMARALTLQNKHTEAIGVLHRMREEAPRAAVLASELSFAAAQMRDFRLAVANFEDYLKLITPSAKDYLRFADLLLYAKELDRAEIALEQAKGDSTEAAPWFFVMAQIHRLKGNYEEAIDACRASLKLNPGNASAWAMLVELVESEELAEHAEQLNTLVSNDSFTLIRRKVQALLALGRSQERQDKVDDSIQSFRSANELAKKQLEERSQNYNRPDYEEFIERSIKTFSRELFDVPAAKIDVTHGQPIFILGLPRSGAALVERILAQHKSLTCGGDQDAVSILVGEYWHHHRQGDMPTIEQLAQAQWNNLAGACMGRYTCNTNGVYTDKMPHNFQHLGFILKMFPNAKVIQMHRDRRDVALSIYQAYFSQAHPYACDIKDTLHFCEHSEKLMSHWSCLNSDQILDVSYETLVERPDFYGKQIMEFCGLPWKQEYLGLDRHSNASFTFTDTQSNQVITQAAVGKWKRYKELFD